MAITSRFFIRVATIPVLMIERFEYRVGTFEHSYGHNEKDIFLTNNGSTYDSCLLKGVLLM